MNRFKEPPPLTLGEQFYSLKARYREGTGSITNKDRTLTWRCFISPTHFSRRYELLIRYTLRYAPECIVLSPDLNKVAGGKNIPHTYGDDLSTGGKKLCLFLPKKNNPEKLYQWRAQLALSETILPWASLWLYYFEYWLSTGEWKGGGAHPADNETGVFFDE